jgi:hypothetical protein
MATKSNPGKYDCYKNAHADEPMFVLLGRDPAAPLCVLAWISIRLACGLNDEGQLREAHDCALAMQAWAIKLDKKSLLARARSKAIGLLANHCSDVMRDSLEAELEEKIDSLVR